MTERTPRAPEELAEALAGASAARRQVRVAGGGTRSRRGRPAPAPDLVLHTRGLDRIVAHEPADMTVTVEAGVLATDLADHVGRARQVWPQAEILPGSTVGGVLAAAASGRGRLRHGPVRDSVLEVVLATGDGRLVKGGGRTVKGVAGYDVPRLAVGSLGTLGVITQVTLKLWPEPPARAWHRAAGSLEERLVRAEAVRRGPIPATALLMTPGALHVCLEGPPEDVVAPRGLSPAEAPGAPAWDATAEIGVPAGRLPELVRALEDEGTPYEAQIGVGICRAAPASVAHVAALRALATGLGGHLQVTDAPEELRGGLTPPPPGLELMRRLRAAFDPTGVLNAPMFVGAAA